jgi:hypothetical protein
VDRGRRRGAGEGGGRGGGVRIEIDLPLVMAARLEAHLIDRSIEIDGHIERSTLADLVLSRVLAGARKAGYGKPIAPHRRRSNPLQRRST